MSPNTLATWGAIVVAGVALYVVTRKPAAAVAAASGGTSQAAAKRQADLRNFFDTQSSQWQLLGGTALPTSQAFILGS